MLSSFWNTLPSFRDVVPTTGRTVNFSKCELHGECRQLTDAKCNHCVRFVCGLHGQFCRSCDAFVCTKNCCSKNSDVCLHCSKGTQRSNMIWVEELRKFYNNKDCLSIYWLYDITERGTFVGRKENEIRFDCLQRTLAGIVKSGKFEDLEALELKQISNKEQRFLAVHFPSTKMFTSSEEGCRRLECFMEEMTKYPMIFEGILMFSDDPITLLRLTKLTIQNNSRVRISVTQRGLTDKEGGCLIKALNETGWADIERNRGTLHTVGNVDAIDVCLEHGLSLEERQRDQTPLTEHFYGVRMDLIEHFLKRGAKLDCAIEGTKRIIPIQCLKVALKCRPEDPQLIHRIPVQKLLIQSSFVGTVQMIELLSHLKYKIPLQFIEEVKEKAAVENSFSCSNSFCLMAFYCLDYYVKEVDEELKVKCRKFVEHNEFKVNDKTFEFLGSELKKKIFTLLLCCKRMEKQIGKVCISKDIKMILLDYCFSHPLLRRQIL